MIKKIKGGYKVVSHTGKSLGTYKGKDKDAKKKAEERLRQVEYFKHKGK